MRSENPRARWTLTRAFVVALLVTSVVTHPVSGETSSMRSGLESVARIPLPADFGGADGRVVVVDPGVRRIFVVQSEARSRILSYDLDTLRPAETNTSAGQSYFTAVSALDPLGHRLFLAIPGDTIDVFDTRDISKQPTSFAGPAGVSGSLSTTAGGLYYSPRDRLLYAFTNAHGPQITAIDPATGRQPWSVELFPKCRLQQSGFSNWRQQAVGESSDGRYLFTLCQMNSASALTGTAPVGVVRLTLPDDPRAQTQQAPAVDLFPGITPGPTIDEALWVPGADRLFVVVETNQGAGWAAYVFDGPTESFVGAPTLFQPSGSAVQYTAAPTIGLDPSSGRIFVHGYARTYTGQRGAQHEPCAKIVSNEFAVVEAGKAALGNSATRFPSGDLRLFGQDFGADFDPVTRNLWMVDFPLEQGPCDITRAQKHLSLAVYHDRKPVLTSRYVSDPDMATTNTPEVDGKTGANYGAQASAYGVRYQMAPSGVEGPLTNADVASVGTLTCNPGTAYRPAWTGSGLATFTGNAPPPPPAPPHYKAFCHAGNRKATFARVENVSLDAQEAAADAIAGETDRVSGEDLADATDATHPGLFANDVVGYADAMSNMAGVPLNRPPPCKETPDPNAPRGVNDSCSPITGTPLASYASGEALPFESADCHDSGGQAQDQTGHVTPYVGQEQPIGKTGPAKATVHCSAIDQIARGAAYTNAPDVGYPIFAHEASASVQVARTAKAGSTASANVIVSAINVGGVLQIGRLEVRADIAAHGRPGTTVVHYSCRVSGVRISPPSGNPTYLPDNTACNDPMLLGYIAQLNGQLEGVLHIEFPPATMASVKGQENADLLVVQQASPGGYVAGVSAARARQLQNTVLLTDPSIEHPALVITGYLDSQSQRDRVIASFGAVALRATYGIYLLANDCGAACAFSPGNAAAIPNPPTFNAPSLLATPSASQPLAAVEEPPAGPVVRVISRGLKLLVHNPGAIPPLLAAWALLAWPVIVMMRRRSFDMFIREDARS